MVIMITVTSRNQSERGIPLDMRLLGEIPLILLRPYDTEHQLPHALDVRAPTWKNYLLLGYAAHLTQNQDAAALLVSIGLSKENRKNEPLNAQFVLHSALGTFDTWYHEQLQHLQELVKRKKAKIRGQQTPSENRSPLPETLTGSISQQVVPPEMERTLRSTELEERLSNALHFVFATYQRDFGDTPTSELLEQGRAFEAIGILNHKPKVHTPYGLEPYYSLGRAYHALGALKVASHYYSLALQVPYVSSSMLEGIQKQLGVSALLPERNDMTFLSSVSLREPTPGFFTQFEEYLTTLSPLIETFRNKILREIKSSVLKSNVERGKSLGHLCDTLVLDCVLEHAGILNLPPNDPRNRHLERIYNSLTLHNSTDVAGPTYDGSLDSVLRILPDFEPPTNVLLQNSEILDMLNRRFSLELQSLDNPDGLLYHGLLHHLAIDAHETRMLEEIARNVRIVNESQRATCPTDLVEDGNRAYDSGAYGEAFLMYINAFFLKNRLSSQEVLDCLPYEPRFEHLLKFLHMPTTLQHYRRCRLEPSKHPSREDNTSSERKKVLSALQENASLLSQFQHQKTPYELIALLENLRDSYAQTDTLLQGYASSVRSNPEAYEGAQALRTQCNQDAKTVVVRLQQERERSHATLELLSSYILENNDLLSVPPQERLQRVRQQVGLTVPKSVSTDGKSKSSAQQKTGSSPHNSLLEQFLNHYVTVQTEVPLVSHALMHDDTIHRIDELLKLGSEFEGVVTAYIGKETRPSIVCRASEKFQREATELANIDTVSRISRAQDAYLRKDYTGAVIHLNGIHKVVSPTYQLERLLGLGKSHLALKEFNIAQRCYLDAVDIEKRSIEGILGLGSAREGLGNVSGAAKAYVAARTLEKAEILGSKNRAGKCLVQLTQKIYEPLKSEALRTESDDSTLLSRVEAFIQLDSERSDGHVLLGIVNEHLGNSESAFDAYNRAIGNNLFYDPEMKERGYVRFVELLLQRGSFTQATEVCGYDLILQYGCSRLSELSEIARLFCQAQESFDNKEYQCSRQGYSHILRFDLTATPAVARHALEGILTTYVRAETTLPDVLRCEDVYLTTADNVNTLAVLAKDAREYETAQNLFTYAQKQDPNLVHPYYHLGTIALGNREYEHAREFFTQALALNSTHRYSHFQIGRTYLGLNNHDQAKIHLGFARDHGILEAKTLLEKMPLHER